MPSALAQQTEPTDEVETNTVQYCPESEMLRLPQRPGVWVQEIALENATIPGA